MNANVIRIKFISLGLSFIMINSIANDKTNLQVNSGKEVILEADELYYDKNTNIAFAKGNVHLEQTGRIISAQQLMYDRESEEIYAYENVVLQELDGNVYFSDQVKIDLKADSAIAVNFKAKMSKESKIASKGAIMEDKKHMQLKEFVYSPCKICPNQIISDYPLWEIRAAKAELDKEAERIYYHSAFVEAFGMPIFYTPYFSTPAPNAKRKSGLLPPKLKFSNVYGASIQTPIYWNIAPNMDMTYRATFMQRKGVFNEIEFRHKIKQGDYTLKGSFITTDKVNKKGQEVSGGQLRGHYDLNGKFTVHKNGYFDIKSRFLYDKPKSYLKKYKISDDAILTTDLNYRYVDDNNYHSARSLFFQGLRPIDDTKTTLNALPIFDGYYEKNIPDFIPSKFYTTYNIANLFREEGSSYEKITVKPTYAVPLSLPYGQLLNTEMSVRIDAYDIKHKQIKKVPSDKPYKKGITRIYPEVYSEWSWPFISFIRKQPVILEPVIGFALGSQIKKKDELNKELNNNDIEYPEISATNLFSQNRFSGDKIEDGTRMSYGLKGNLKSIYFKNLNFLVGQAVRKKEDEEFDYRSGLKGKMSNIVSKLSLQLNDKLSASHRARYDQKTLSPLRNEFNFSWYEQYYNFSAIYAGANKNIITQQGQKFRQEFLLNASYNFYGSYWMKGFVHSGLSKRLRIEKKTMVEEGVSLEYKGDCLIFEVGARRNHLSIGDAKSSSSYFFNFMIPTF